MVHVSWGLILACGKTEQLMPGVDTAFLGLNGQPLVSYALRAFEACEDIDGIAVVVSKDHMQEVAAMVKLFGLTKLRRIVAGSSQRLTSIKAGIAALDENVSLLTIHEASRPLIKPDVICEVVKAAKRYGCAAAGERINSLVRITGKGQKREKTLDAGTAWEAQTPQGFRIEVLNKAIAAAAKKKTVYADEVAYVEAIKGDVHMIPTNNGNFKITQLDDLQLAEAFLKM